MKIRIVCLLGVVIVLLTTACSCGNKNSDSFHINQEESLTEIKEVPSSNDYPTGNCIGDIEQQIAADFSPEFLLSSVIPLEIAMAKCGEFAFEKPEDLSNDQLFMAFLSLADPLVLESGHVEGSTIYRFEENVIRQTLDQFFDGTDFCVRDDMWYDLKKGDEVVNWDLSLGVTGKRNATIRKSTIKNDIVTFIVDYYASGKDRAANKPYCSKEYVVQICGEKLKYLSATFCKDDAWLFDESSVPKQEVKDLIEKAIMPLLRRIELGLNRNGFTFRDPSEFDENELYTLFLLLSEYDELLACFNEKTNTFCFSEEQICDKLAKYFKTPIFDITKARKYNSSENAIVTHNVSGFGGDITIEPVACNALDDTILLTVGFYGDSELHYSPYMTKEYVIELTEEGYFFRSAILTQPVIKDSTLAAVFDNAHDSESGFRITNVLSSFSTEQVNCNLDSLVNGIAISRADGSEVIYPLPVATIQIATKYYDEEYYKEAIHCIADGDRMVLFIPPFSSDAVVAISEDRGVTWEKCPVPGTYGSDVTGSYLGDIPGGGIWLVIRGAIGMGLVDHTLYCKMPGEDWVRYDAFDTMEHRPLDYVTFLPEGVAFVSVGAGSDGKFPLLYCSTNGGKNWEKCVFTSDSNTSDLGIDSIEKNDGIFEMKCTKLTEMSSELDIYISDNGLVWSEQ